MICGNAKYFEVSSVYTEHGSIVNSNWRPVFGVFIQRGTASSLPSSQERSAISHICSVFISVIEHQFLNYVAIGFIPRLRLIDARHIRARRSKTPRKDVEDEEEESWTLPDNAKHTKNRPYSMYIFIRMKWWSHISKKNITPWNWHEFGWSSSESFLCAIKCLILRLHMFLSLLEFRVELAIHFFAFLISFTSFSFGFQFSAEHL